MEQTEAEKKISEIVVAFFGSQMNDKVRKTVENIRIKLVQESDDDSLTAMIVMLPLKILDLVHLNFTQFKKEIVDFLDGNPIFFVREAEYNSLTKALNKKCQEKWVFDLCYPATVQNRITEIKNKGETVIEKAILERKCDFLQDDFSLMENAYKTLTEKTIIYSIRHY